jgi:hypothetical protein
MQIVNAPNNLREIRIHFEDADVGEKYRVYHKDLISSTGRRAYWMAMVAVVLLHVAVLWIPAYNALVDFPCHLSRAWALHTYDRTPFFQTVFYRVFTPVPNLAIDLAVPPLLHFLPPIAAGKVFLSLIVLLFAAGCHWLAVIVHGRPSSMAHLATFAVFNSTFLYGFVNSSFSVCLFLVALAAWLRFRPQWTVAGWVMVTALATATYIAHLSGFVFLGLAMGVFFLLDLQKNRRIRVAEIAGFSVLLPAVAIQLYPWAHKVTMSGQIGWGTPGKKMLGLVSVFLGYHYALSAVTVVLLAAAFAVAAIKGRWRMERTFLALGLVFLVSSFICPSESSGGGWSGADARFVPPAIVFLFLSFMVIERSAIARLVLGLAFAAMMLRLGDIGWSLARASSAAEQQMAALAKADTNSRIYDLFVRSPDRQTDKLTRSNLHLASYSLILTESVSSDFFAAPGAQPLCFRHPKEWTGNESTDAFDPAFLDAHLGNFDYLWGCNLNPAQSTYVAQRATLVSTGDICGLWKLKK